MTRNGLSLDDKGQSGEGGLQVVDSSNQNIPMIISGDFNSAPFSSLLHMMNNRAYDPDKVEDARFVPEAYANEFGVQMFRQVDEEYQKLKDSLSNV